MSDKFFETLPYNVEKLYISATSKTGCEIIVPVAFDEDIPRVRDRLDHILQNQPTKCAV